MANVLKGVGSNSGGDWHQDEMCTADLDRREVCTQQMKCLVMLDDFDTDNGPFTLLVDYSRSEMTKWHKPASRLPGNGRDDWRRHRFSEKSILRETNRAGAFVLEVHAPVGSVVCFDSGNSTLPCIELQT